MHSCINITNTWPVSTKFLGGYMAVAQICRHILFASNRDISNILIFT